MSGDHLRASSLRRRSRILPTGAASTNLSAIEAVDSHRSAGPTDLLIRFKRDWRIRHLRPFKFSWPLPASYIGAQTAVTPALVNRVA